MVEPAPPPKPLTTPWSAIVKAKDAPAGEETSKSGKAGSTSGRTDQGEGKGASKASAAVSSDTAAPKAGNTSTSEAAEGKRRNNGTKAASKAAADSSSESPAAQKKEGETGTSKNAEVGGSWITRSNCVYETNVSCCTLMAHATTLILFTQCSSILKHLTNCTFCSLVHFNRIPSPRQPGRSLL